MTDRHLATLLAFSLLTLTACGDPPPVTPDASTPDDAATPDAGPSCAGGTTMCGDECVDTASSRANCGACGTVCATAEACIEGDCAVVCPSGQSECAGICADTQSDGRHCGACGTTCAAGELCVAGSCEISCPAGQTVCGSSCVDHASDPANCGACGTVCDAGEVCSAGVCAASCGGGATDCGGACVDTATSAAHCGGCGMACGGATSATGLCVAGACRAVCDAFMGDCNADRGDAAGDGCETPLGTDPNNCGACARVCSLPDAVAGCVGGVCAIAACDAGLDDCDGDAINGCETELLTDDSNCGACGAACGSGTRCSAGSCVTVVGDTCSSAIALTPGANTVAWTAFGAEYLLAPVSCGFSYDPEGPDLVLTYTATTEEDVTITFNKSDSTRWAAIVSTSACGTLTPELDCVSEFSDTTMDASFRLTAGQTAYVYLADTESGALPLENPVRIDVAALDCSEPPPVTVSPMTGSTSSTLSPLFTATFGAPVTTDIGIVTITRSTGTSISYDLSTSPSEVSFSSSNTVMEIDAGIPFTPGEVLTLSWTGIEATPCSTAVTVPSPAGWGATIVTPSCAPGVGGIVGSTATRLETLSDTTSFTEYYVAVDQSPTGYVYIGGTSSLYRVPKAGGLMQTVHTFAGLGTSQLGYAMLVDGQNIYTVDDTTSTGAARLFRVSTDGGASWVIQNYATFATDPEDDFRGVTVHNGRIYLVTSESTTGDATEIWSVDANAPSLPAAATLERSFSGEQYCHGIARDSTYYYVTCGTDDRVVRVPVTGAATPELLTNAFDLSTTAGAVHGNDLDADGEFDVLYVQGDREEVGYVCSPAGATPYADRLMTFGTSTTNYGLGFDRAANVLWMMDDDTQELVSIQ